MLVHNLHVFSGTLQYCPLLLFTQPLLVNWSTTSKDTHVDHYCLSLLFAVQLLKNKCWCSTLLPGHPTKISSSKLINPVDIFSPHFTDCLQQHSTLPLPTSHWLFKMLHTLSFPPAPGFSVLVPFADPSSSSKPLNTDIQGLDPALFSLYPGFQLLFMCMGEREPDDIF